MLIDSVSRKRADKKQKSKELARQMGVSRAETADHHYLKERARVTRPQVRLRDQRIAKGFLGRTKKPLLAQISLYVVDAQGARVIESVLLASKEAQMKKSQYTRPAHFVALFQVAKSQELFCEEPHLHLDFNDEKFKSQQWESAQAVELPGVKAFAMSIRGVDRTKCELTLKTQQQEFDIEIRV